MDRTEAELERLVDERARAIVREEKQAEALARERERADARRAEERRDLWAAVVATRKVVDRAKADERDRLTAGYVVRNFVTGIFLAGLLVVAPQLALQSTPPSGDTVVHYLFEGAGTAMVLTALFVWVLRRVGVGTRRAWEAELASAAAKLRDFDALNARPTDEQPYR